MYRELNEGIILHLILNENKKTKICFTNHNLISFGVLFHIFPFYLI